MSGLSHTPGKRARGKTLRGFESRLLRQDPLLGGFFSSQNPLVPLPAVLLRMEQHQGLTYQRDAVRRQPFALRSSCFNIQIRRVNNPIWTTIHSQMDES